MNIIHLKHRQIDKTLWDKTISTSINRNVYGFSWYLDQVSPNWEALILPDYSMVFPLTMRRKYGIAYLFQPYFTQQLGVYSTQKLPTNILSVFFAHIPSKFKYIDIKLNKYNQVAGFDFSKIENNTYELDLIGDYDTIYKLFSENARRNIKKSTQFSNSIALNINPLEVVELFKENKGKQISKLKEEEYSLLKKIIAVLIRKNKLESMGVYNQNKVLIAGALFIRDLNKLYFLFSGNNQQARETGSMFLLIDKYIRQNCSRNFTLDFCGSNDENVARFYRGFGAKKCTYYRIQKNNLPFFLKRLKAT